MSRGGFDSAVVQSAYASVADDYAATFSDDLPKLELDRRILDVMAERGPRRLPVLDLGCGPAPVAAYLVAHGAPAIAVDFTEAMLQVARERVSGLRVVAADLRALPIRSGRAGGIVAFYVLQHVPRDDLADCLTELRRSIVPGGLVALAVHEGEGEYQVGEVTGTRYRADELSEHLAGAGFVVEMIEYRDPLAHEHQARRIYLIGRAA